jgi:hypothetical protein
LFRYQVDPSTVERDIVERDGVRTPCLEAI